MPIPYYFSMTFAGRSLSYIFSLSPSKNQRPIAGYSAMGSRKRAQSLRRFTLWHWITYTKIEFLVNGFNLTSFFKIEYHSYKWHCSAQGIQIFYCVGLTTTNCFDITSSMKGEFFNRLQKVSGLPVWKHAKTGFLFRIRGKYFQYSCMWHYTLKLFLFFKTFLHRGRGQQGVCSNQWVRLTKRGGIEWHLEKRGSRKILARSRNVGSVFERSRSLVSGWVF